MSVGHNSFACYENEDIEGWDVTFSDANIIDISGDTLQYVVKALATDPDPPLLTLTIANQTTNGYRVKGNIALAAGSYVGGTRKTDSGHSRQYTVDTISVASSPNEDH